MGGTRKGGAWVEKERIGLMGGSFNPIHQGHVAMARRAMEVASLNKVLFIPTGNPPHKREGLADAAARLFMVRMAVAFEEGFYPSTIEMNRSGIVYSVDTLSLLHEQMPQASLFFIIGEDTLYELPHWRDPDRVFTLCSFLVCPRPGVAAGESAASFRKALEDRGAKLQNIPMVPMNLSSTAIRDQLEKGNPPDGVSPAVEEYIRVMGLYGAAAHPKGASGHMNQLLDAVGDARMAHTLSVAITARNLAKQHDVNAEKAELAGLYHDCAKGMTLKALQAYADEHGLKADEISRNSGALLHSMVGAHLAKFRYGVEDTDVLEAITCHTLGRIPMSKLDMVVFLADKIEPTRETYTQLEEIRRLAKTSLAGAVLKSMESTAGYVQSRGKAMHPAMWQVMAWLKSLNGA